MSGAPPITFRSRSASRATRVRIRIDPNHDLPYQLSVATERSGAPRSWTDRGRFASAEEAVAEAETVGPLGAWSQHGLLSLSAFVLQEEHLT